VADEHLDLNSPSIVSESSDRDLALMSVDALWSLRQNIDAVLASKINDELNDLKRQLDRLRPKASSDQRSSRKRPKAKVQRRRSYRSVLPKYQNPMRPRETWTGRGRRPNWIKEQLILGKPLEDFRIATSEAVGHALSL
jgi:DNA-binding protein H-NS